MDKNYFYVPKSARLLRTAIGGSPSLGGMPFTITTIEVRAEPERALLCREGKCIKLFQ